ncbi:hypothetical protein OKA05_01950 [Luteolibacter arcticus]|uniref:TolA protein n=1 Tax=Luteolibacter arcticus TaxID=1581411 RepID=A0ABT3GCE4_9BACT|nr:hypothetical protein [Luteolibacter arcticus]MCW1921295.1 hypothetical protein [Luteolibacter arcticus]
MSTITESIADPAADLTTILSLEGAGYTLSVSAETDARKVALIHAAAGITQVGSVDESAAAHVHIRHLAAFRNSVEKSRTEAKAPIIELGRKIDAAAKAYIDVVTAEENRLKLCVGAFATKQAEEKRKAEAEERRKFEEARLAREAAERAAREAEDAKRKAAEATNIQAAIAAKQEAREAEAAAARAEEERQAAQRERMAQSAVVATTRVAGGVKFEPDFEVVDIARLAAEAPMLVTIEPKRRELLAFLKGLHADGADLEAIGLGLGLRVTLKPVVSTR